MTDSSDPKLASTQTITVEPSAAATTDHPAEAETVVHFLTRASQCLAASLDYESTLVTVAQMALPYLGSWCIVDIVEGDGSIRRLAIVHPDPLKQEHARKLKEGWPPDRHDPIGLPRAIQTRVTEVISIVSD